jgi:PAS domain S-box-containing protein
MIDETIGEIQGVEGMKLGKILRGDGTRSRAHKDLITISVAAVLVLAVAIYFDAFDQFTRWYVTKEEPGEIEELTVVVFVCAFAFAIFSYRRWRELTVETKDRERAEDAFRESRQLLADIINFLPDATLVIDREGKVIAWNRAIEEMTGIKDSEILGKGDYEYSLPFYGKRRPILVDYVFQPQRAVEAGYTRIESNGDILIAEAYTPELGGGEVYLSATAAALRDSRGNIIGAIESIRNLTERKRTEDAVKESEARHQDILNRAPSVIYIKDKQGRHTFVNRHFEKLSGYSSEEILGRTDFELFPPEVARKSRENDNAVLERGSPLEIEEIAPVGIEMHTFISVKFPLSDLKGESYAICGISTDINERKRTEQALQNSHSLLAATLESTADGILVVDTAGRVVSFNRSFLELWRIPESLISTRDDEQLLEFVLDQLSYPDAFLDKVRALYQTPEASSMDELVFKDGRIFERYSQPQRIEDNIVGRVWSFRDITERKRATEERSKLEERLQRAEKMEALGTLAGGVAHDLNNVLGIVVGYSEMLLMDLEQSSPERLQAMEILKGGQRAAAIVQDLLTLARRGVPSRRTLNLNNILMDCQNSPEFAKLLSFHPKVRIKTDVETDLLNIAGSSVHLGKSFLNLVSNAAEAMADGGVINIKTRNQYLDRPVLGYEEVKEGDYVVLSISDEGEGIESVDLKRIFEPFYTKKVMGRSGTGLGLAVVWGSVKDHYGYINVESETGRGTVFTLYFPVTRQEMAPEQTAVSASEYMGSGESILVVDDIKEQRELATTMLKKLNYRVASVFSGEQAVEYLKQHRVDLVVLDMIMEPGMVGLDTYRGILELRPDQKAIIVSGFAETERVSKAQSLGAGTYVKKPYVLGKLGLAVRREFDRTN